MPDPSLRQFVKDSAKLLEPYLRNFQETFDANRTRAFLFFKGLLEKLRGGAVSPLDLVIRYPGYFYFFMYRSKLYYEEKLDFYDAFPLILVLKSDKKGFLGINWHYIHPRHRALILKRLILYYPEAFFKDKWMIPMNWKKLLLILGKEKKFISFAIKRYLWKQMRRTRAARVKNIDMIDAISYCSPQWVGTTEQELRTLVRRHNEKYGNRL